MDVLQRDECSRCGEVDEGRYKLMTYGMIVSILRGPIQREFFCNRCLRAMKWQSIIGLTLLLVLLLTLGGILLFVL